MLIDRSQMCDLLFELDRLKAMGISYQLLVQDAEPLFALMLSTEFRQIGTLIGNKPNELIRALPGLLVANDINIYTPADVQSRIAQRSKTIAKLTDARIEYRQKLSQLAKEHKSADEPIVRIYRARLDATIAELNRLSKLQSADKRHLPKLQRQI